MTTREVLYAEVERALSAKLSQCGNAGEREVVFRAMKLHPANPALSHGQLIRLAYWGASGSDET
jgi:hypothetical protein